MFSLLMKVKAHFTTSSKASWAMDAALTDLANNVLVRIDGVQVFIVVDGMRKRQYCQQHLKTTSTTTTIRQ